MSDPLKAFEELPEELHMASIELDRHFQQRGFKEWRMGGCCSRAWAESLQTALSLEKEKVKQARNIIQHIGYVSSEGSKVIEMAEKWLNNFNEKEENL